MEKQTQSRRNVSQDLMIRVLVVVVAGLGLGFILHGDIIFVPTMVPFQFTLAGITAALTYGFLKSPSPRNAMAALLVWYVGGMVFIGTRHAWPFFQFAAYLVLIASAVCLSTIADRTSFVKGRMQRIALISVLTGFMNVLMVFVFAAISFRTAAAHLDTVFSGARKNLQFGILIGLSIGLGMELAEFLISKLDQKEARIGLEMKAPK